MQAFSEFSPFFSLSLGEELESPNRVVVNLRGGGGGELGLCINFNF